MSAIEMPRRLCSACQSTALRGHITEAWASSIASHGHICEEFPGVRLQTWSAMMFSQSIILRHVASLSDNVDLACLCSTHLGQSGACGL